MREDIFTKLGFPYIAATLSHWGQASSRKQSKFGMHGLSNILKLYKQRSSIQFITNEQVKLISFIYMRIGRFHAGSRPTINASHIQKPTIQQHSTIRERKHSKTVNHSKTIKHSKTYKSLYSAPAFKKSKMTSGLVKHR